MSTSTGLAATAQEKADAMIRHLAGLAEERLVISFAAYTPYYAVLKRIGELFPGPSKVRLARVRARVCNRARSGSVWLECCVKRIGALFPGPFQGADCCKHLLTNLVTSSGVPRAAQLLACPRATRSALSPTARPATSVGLPLGRPAPPRVLSMHRVCQNVQQNAAVLGRM